VDPDGESLVHRRRDEQEKELHAYADAASDVFLRAYGCHDLAGHQPIINPLRPGRSQLDPPDSSSLSHVGPTDRTAASSLITGWVRAHDDVGLLGRSLVVVLFQTQYAHVIPGMQAEAAELVATLVANSRPANR
jgi:hypothetical protein